MYCPGAILLGLITLSFANVIGRQPLSTNPKASIVPPTNQTLDLRISVDELSEHDPSTDGHCFWSGTSPFCAGSCPSNYEDCRTDSCGDGACCWTGYKKYCCQGGCPNKKSLDVASHDGAVHETGEPDNDICDPSERICCPPDAEKNSQCRCYKP
ncbi:hypothetical protein DIS24_g8712 [Lasiodiplodia hormozganensis]|uniref:Uncharacterized protein n=1 Tax=Lasiodiplodia hormozganensis TaxID=869390 RepID=A0AA40CKY4_9PEZI|nr:hypothetical protein DIS24_g8712 [Lasiodiplodia hormozganensis]